MDERSDVDRKPGEDCPASPVARPAGLPVRWLTFAEATAASDGSAARALAAWFEGFLMRPHAELGRAGHVCPYMARAARADLVRIAVSDLTSADAEAILVLLGTALNLFDDMECVARERAFRTVVVAFPGCNSREEIAGLEKILKRLRYRSALLGHMVGLFEPDSRQGGVSNRMFLSFRTPVPTIAIRSLVARDAPFVLRNAPMIPLYLARFGRAGCRRLMGVIRHRLAEAREGRSR